MRYGRSRADALLAGEGNAVDEATRSLLKPLRANFVERPWGGTRIRGFKGLCLLPDQRGTSGAGLGEAFELAAWDEDREARQYPSRLRFEDGSETTLPALLEARGEELLGEAFVARYGKAWPLLPKILDIGELLSVQGHPEGNTETYIVIDAEPGATLRLGFCEDIRRETFEAELLRGGRQQEALLEAVGGTVEPAELQAVLGPWMARRDLPVSALTADGELAGPLSRVPPDLLAELKALYWGVLDTMNAIEVRPGQVIHNANPPRILAGTGGSPSAEVHALGNPEGKEVLLLEIRRPGPTFRAWDHVRFPIRAVDVGAALDALNLQRTEAEEFIVEPEPVPGRSGTFCSVACDSYRVEHLRPANGLTVAVPAEPPHCLHVLGGRARFSRADGSVLGTLDKGESALVPVAVGAYRAEALASGAEIVKVSLPVGE